MKFRIRQAILRLLLTGVAVAAFVASAPAEPVSVFNRSGRINHDFAYEDLDVKLGSYTDTRQGRVYSCAFKGKIVNTTYQEQKNVTIKFTAFNGSDEKMWESSVYIDSLPRDESRKFSNPIPCQSEEDPYRWTIEVIEGQLPPPRTNTDADSEPTAGEPSADDNGQE